MEGTNAHQGRPVRQEDQETAKRRAWASMGGLSWKSYEIIEEGLFTNQDAGAPEVKWFTQETESEFKHRISCLFRIQRLWFKKVTILPLWNPHFPLFRDLENPFLLSPFWFSLCLERKRQGKLVSPEPIRHIADNQERSLPALNQALSHPVATLNSAKLLSVPLSRWSPKLWDDFPLSRS